MKYVNQQSEPILIGIFDRKDRVYHIYHDPAEVRPIIDGYPLSYLNENFEFAIDGHILPWPSADPDLIEQYIHEFISDKLSS